MGDDVTHVTLGQTLHLRKLLNDEHIDWWWREEDKMSEKHPDYTAWLNEWGECFESKDGPEDLVALKVTFVCTPEEAVALSKCFIRELGSAQ